MNETHTENWLDDTSHSLKVQYRNYSKVQTDLNCLQIIEIIHRRTQKQMQSSHKILHNNVEASDGLCS